MSTNSSFTKDHTITDAATKKDEADTGKDAITLTNIHFSYDKNPFIQGLSASFKSGAVTSIVGPNGCGKSTLVKIIDAILRPQKGEAQICGTPTLTMRMRERASKLAILVQAGHPPAMTVQELVSCGRFPYQQHHGGFTEEDKRLIQLAMQETGVKCFANKDVRQLSGGERQRAFLAMTLAQDTDIIVLDEPTTYLDIHACHDIMQLVRELNKNMNKTFVMVIHDLDLALRYSDEILVMQAGRAIFAGDTKSKQALQALEQAFSSHIAIAQTEFGAVHAIFPRGKQ
ncbi:MAG: ABC transporter ATP-binding protein [Coriobacteriales bacterium]|jgi:iron complex transport system ATP-binding protein|nr:ABC transporter ATP-binding protein [Coriobacteriales bacterium]